MPSDDTHITGGVPAGLEFFFAPPGAVNAGKVVIEGEEFAHLTHVMRHREGDTIGIVDGAGMAYVAVITGMHKRAAHCTILSSHPGLHEPSRRLTLAIGMLKNPSRFDTAVEKASELGAGMIIPMFTARTIPRHAKIDRWQTIALASMKQCGRSVLPIVTQPATFEEVLQRGEGDRLLLHEKAAEPLTSVALPGGTTQCTVCIGPEGGFTDEEVAAAVSHHWRVVSLGTRRLRSETAAIAAAVRLIT